MRLANHSRPIGALLGRRNLGSTSSFLKGHRPVFILFRNVMASGTDTALHMAEAVTARDPLESPALGTFAAFQGVPAPQTTNNALTSTDAHLLETQHDTSTIPEDHNAVVQLGDAEVEKAQLPSDTDWPPPDRRSISYFKLYRCVAMQHSLAFLARARLAFSNMSGVVHNSGTVMVGIFC